MERFNPREYFEATRKLTRGNITPDIDNKGVLHLRSKSTYAKASSSPLKVDFPLPKGGKVVPQRQPKEKRLRLRPAPLPEASKDCQTTDADKLTSAANIPQPIDVYTPRELPNGFGSLEPQRPTHHIENPARNLLNEFYRPLPDAERGKLEAKRFAKALNFGNDDQQRNARASYDAMLRDANVCPTCYNALHGHTLKGVLSVRDIPLDKLDRERKFLSKWVRRAKYYRKAYRQAALVRGGTYKALYEHIPRSLGLWYADVKSHWIVQTIDDHARFAPVPAHRTNERCHCIR